MALRRIIIFDFNRTLYDPDHRKLFSDVPEVLKIAKSRGYDLYLVSSAMPSRKELVHELGLHDDFAKVIITDSKRDGFESIALEKDIDFRKSFVVGDRVVDEITLGNKLGMQTIWLCAGRFADEMPTEKVEKPIFVIKELKEVLRII
ncbi:MAG: hypothetical protein A3A33_04390 [Candidatus Yanofskybacteria bacterium RIFCSPLOWO2_01_FULL_49_25]|uniref:HAD family hydrolase n=1 Tax=Candidatus Yanofskybacteria bacterium RIFCSPLOWO2_01_FULL_49_25 TaxID=1802701 RepID=A0A1F8GWB9_9BACT|nr:MAG: hypothetical protein A3A33_04390 [Candidatus Yanofskybacteria bacterium RIFCSPLOWO2_01_FULL_49_25]